MGTVPSCARSSLLGSGSASARQPLEEDYKQTPCLGVLATWAICHRPLGDRQLLISRCLCPTPAKSWERAQYITALIGNKAKKHGANGVGELAPQTYQGARDQHNHGKCQPSMPSQNQGGLGEQEMIVRWSSCRITFIQAARTKVVLDTVCARFPYQPTLCRSALLPRCSQAHPAPP